MDRRAFLGTAGLGVAGLSLPNVRSAPTGGRAYPNAPFDPWLEIDTAALRENVSRLSAMVGKRPIMAVVKNNAYGLGLREATSVLEPLPEIAGFAVVKPGSALRLREWGVRKPVLLMGLADDEEAIELSRRGVELSFYVGDAAERAGRVARATGAPVSGQVYLDTGMGRMGIPSHQALPWLRKLAESEAVDVRGTFMAFTEDGEYDPVQLERLLEFARTARAEGLPTGALHAASSNGVFHLPDAHLDLVRPGIALYGAYPSRPEEERAIQPLVPAVRLCARVVRTQLLRPGDGVSYGRNYVAERPTWTATLPVGHTDGLPRGSVDGAQVLVGGRLYPVIGAVSASHCIVEVGDEPRVSVGDKAVLLGSDHRDVEPNALARASGSSVYDVLMHLSPSLPRRVV